MDRHSRPLLQRAATSGTFHGDQMTRTSVETRHGRARAQADEATSSRNRQRRRSDSTDSTSDQPMPYACPYAKHDPMRYSHSHKAATGDHDYRNCSTGYWTNVARLKQHLYRTHYIDRSTRCCERCWRNFPSDKEFHEHVARSSCKTISMPEGKMTKEQHGKIKDRVQGKHFDSWYTIYGYLFPEDDVPASPYSEWVTGEDLRNCFEGLTERLPQILLQAAMKIQPQARGMQIGPSDLFPTSEEIVQQALILCQKEFGRATGLSHIFAIGSPSPTSSVSSKRGTAPATKIRPNPDQQLNRHSRHVSVNTHQMAQAVMQGCDDLSSSSDDMDVEPTSAEARHKYDFMNQELQRGQPSGPLTMSMPYTTDAFTAATTMTPLFADHNLLQTQFDADLSDLYDPYATQDMSLYGWQQ